MIILYQVILFSLVIFLSSCATRPASIHYKDGSYWVKLKREYFVHNYDNPPSDCYSELKKSLKSNEIAIKKYNKQKMLIKTKKLTGPVGASGGQGSVQVYKYFFSAVIKVSKSNSGCIITLKDLNYYQDRRLLEYVNAYYFDENYWKPIISELASELTPSKKPEK